MSSDFEKFQPRQRQDNTFRLPLWSILLTMMLALAAAFCFAGLLIALGGRTAPGGEPRIVMITVSPVLTLEESAQETATPISTGQRPTVVFRLSGPTLPPPNITPTPENVAVGKTVKVISVGDQQLNVRNVAGVLGTEVVFRIPEGQLLTVIDGPQQADGLTWWRVQTVNESNSGWAAANYLEVVRP